MMRCDEEGCRRRLRRGALPVEEQAFDVAGIGMEGWGRIR